MERKNVNIDIYEECIELDDFRRIIDCYLEKHNAFYDSFDYNLVMKGNLSKKCNSHITRGRIARYSTKKDYYWSDCEDYCHEYKDDNVEYYFSYYYHYGYKEAQFILDIEYK